MNNSKEIKVKLNNNGIKLSEILSISTKFTTEVDKPLPLVIPQDKEISIYFLIKTI